MGVKMKLQSYVNEVSKLIDEKVSQINFLQEKLKDSDYHARILGENLQARMIRLKEVKDPQDLLNQLMNTINNTPSFLKLSYNDIQYRIHELELEIQGIYISLDLLANEIEKNQQHNEDMELIKTAKTQERGRRKIGDRPESIAKVRKAMERLSQNAKNEE
jgi:hypothetical protein